MSDQITFHTLFDSVRMKNRTIDSTIVTAQLIVGNSSFIMSKLTIAANLVATIECDLERISYQPQNSKFYYVYNRGQRVKYIISTSFLNSEIFYLFNYLTFMQKNKNLIPSKCLLLFLYYYIYILCNTYYMSQSVIWRNISRAAGYEPEESENKA